MVVSGNVASAGLGVPRYHHVFLLIDENHNYSSIVGNPAVPEINARAADYVWGSQSRLCGVAVFVDGSAEAVSSLEVA